MKTVKTSKEKETKKKIRKPIFNSIFQKRERLRMLRIWLNQLISNLRIIKKILKQPIM